MPPLKASEKYSVLIIEDSDTLRHMVTLALEERGYHITSAADGVTGLHALTENVPDAVILDLNLPDIDGFEVCKRIKAEPRTHNIPVIVLTSLEQSGFEIMAIEAGADDFIAKPVDPLVLDARIQMVVRRMRRERFANALTGLPANALSEERLEFLLARKHPFAVTFVDIDDFREFNRRYGYARGDLVLRHLATLLVESVRFSECEDAFVGHMGADDFIVVCDPANAEAVAREAAKAWDMSVLDFYEDEDRERGYYTLVDRNGNEVRHGPITLSLAVVPVLDEFPESVITITDTGLELLDLARSKPGSTVAVLTPEGPRLS
jgi:diguanylate cyclase (GGDEF)-like protein